MRSYTVKKPFEGVLRNLQRRWQETDSAWVREEMSRFQADKPCAVCHGARLKPEALAVKIAGHNLAQAAELPIRRALAWFQDAGATLTPQRQEIARRIFREIVERLQFLVDVGLDYLTWPAAAPRCPAAKASASGSPARSAPASPACCMCWTNPASACTSATTSGCSARCAG